MDYKKKNTHLVGDGLLAKETCRTLRETSGYGVNSGFLKRRRGAGIETNRVNGEALRRSRKTKKKVRVLGKARG